MDGEIELSIVMPCLNEAKTIAACVQKARQFCEQNGVRYEIVVGDNGSTDGSQEIARQCGARVIDIALRGYGAALFFASQAARGRFIIMGDADDSYDFSNLMPILNRLRGGDELVMGNRFAGGIEAGAMPWKNRYIGNPIISSIGRLFFGIPVRDFLCGLRGFSASAFIAMDLRTTGMEYAAEMIVKAALMELRISEVPVKLSRDGRLRRPHLRPWRDGWRYLRFMLLYSPRWLFLYPGIALFLAGAVAMIWLLPAPRTIGHVTFDVHSILYASVAVLMGFQAITFAVFSKLFVVQEGLARPSQRLDRIFYHVTLEHGIAIGMLLVIAGLALAIYSIAQWRAVGFGPLDVRHTLRYAIPSALCLALGTQTIFASFFLSVLGLRVRRLGQR